MTTKPVRRSKFPDWTASPALLGRIGPGLAVTSNRNKQDCAALPPSDLHSQPTPLQPRADFLSFSYVSPHTFTDAAAVGLLGGLWTSHSLQLTLNGEEFRPRQIVAPRRPRRTAGLRPLLLSSTGLSAFIPFSCTTVSFNVHDIAGCCPICRHELQSPFRSASS